MNNRKALILKASIKNKIDKYDSLHIEEEMEKINIEIEDFGKDNELINTCFFLLLSESKDSNKKILANNIHWIFSCLKESDSLSVNDIGAFGISHIDALQFCLFTLNKGNLFKEREGEDRNNYNYPELFNTYKLFSAKDFKLLTFEEKLDNQYNIIKNLKNINRENFQKLIFNKINENLNFWGDFISIENNFPDKLFSYENKVKITYNITELLSFSYENIERYHIDSHKTYSKLAKMLIDTKNINSWQSCLKVLITNCQLLDKDTEFLIGYFNENLQQQFKEDDWHLYEKLLNRNRFSFPFLMQKHLLRDSNINMSKKVNGKKFKIERI